ncbi:MAG: peptidase M14 [Ignavibacteriales bacterium]|nr:MAG: peptidase M14 [Ignavibacteriales bacterium]
MKIIFLSLIFLIVSFAQNKDEWQTYFEKSGFTGTSSYEETMKYFKKLDENSDYAKLITFGISPQGRELNYLIVSDKSFTPANAKDSGKPVILIINGIHAGEIEGKDALMILLREILITKEKEELIDDVILLIIPIFNVDGHERSNKYNRINQNGPEEMGWRTTAQNLNLNRDWMKADAPEMQAMLKLFSEWLPDFLIDNHSTDGADYQYTITFGIEYFNNSYIETKNMLKDDFAPFLHKKVNEAGYQSYPYVGLRNWSAGLESGITEYPASPRLSNGYAAIQNRPALLVETHMIKPYKERVYSTKAANEAVIEFCSLNKKKLIELNKKADDNSIINLTNDDQKLPLQFKLSDKSVKVPFKGMRYYKEKSDISGSEKIVYTDEKINMEIQLFNDPQVVKEITVPEMYIIPKEWFHIIDRIKLHGIDVNVLEEDKTFDVKRYRFTDVKLTETSFEGRQRASFTTNEYYEKVKVPAGSFLVSTKQREVRIITHLLEPEGDDSFMKWGFFNAVLEQKEYFEPYVMEKLASEMLKEDPQLLIEFEEKLNLDEEFRNSSFSRLNFFYTRSPYYDSHFNVYPVLRVE